MICSIYSHNPDFDRILEIVQNVYPKGLLSTSQQDGSTIIAIEIKGGLFSSSKKIKVSYRQRNIPSYQLPDIDDSPLTTNLKGMYGLVSSLPAKNEKIKDLLLHKIPTLNCEFSVIQEQGETKEIKTLIQTLAHDLDAILFAQPGTIISRSAGQHFLDKNLNLIIDGEGNCEINNLEVKINTTYFDKDQGGLTKDQQERKEKSEKFIEEKNIKINRHLPAIEPEEETVIRSPREIAQRVSILAITNFVAFNTISSEEAMAYLQQYDLWKHVTPGEKNFLANPTEEKKNQETWKCEGIWTLMWVLKKVDELGPPHELCNLQN